MGFPKDFLWGAATASYQIEGAVNEDGRGECIWHRFSHTPGKIVGNDNGDRACNHYHLYEDDVKLMQGLGLDAYRFSVAWARILPEGTGAVNPAGLDFYDRLVDSLLQAKIRPFLTLYHWDLPQALQDRGGWANPDSVKWYADYTAILTERLGDRVKDWITINEPWVVAFLGNLMGIHAPGIKDPVTAYKVAHHVLLAHGAAVPVVREKVADAKVGITLDLAYFQPASDSEEDVAAAYREDGFKNRWFLDPVFKGHYPADMVEFLAPHLEGLDLESISAAAVETDFIGINYYTRNVIAASEDGFLKSRTVPADPDNITDIGWDIYPDGLRDLLVRVKDEYGDPVIYVTENGSAYDDPDPVDGLVEDPKRQAYLAAHVDAVKQAIARGARVNGYFVWSLLDNFEWAEGYAKRFGVVHINYDTFERTHKSSALYYKERIAQEKAAVEA